ncbi:hypothetical protein LDC_0101 [sediment metagenome]|uniref:PilZ domain-containing protein n=1 Tax=sediment metagenome TaxID=749907 RepID=D9PF23_9ZZZZ
MNNKSNERREFSRVPFVQQVTLLTSKGKVSFSESSNLSMGGIFLVTDPAYPLNTTGLLIITIIEPDDRKTILSGEFKVIHTIAKDNTDGFTAGMGVEFIEFDEKARLSLERITRQMEAGSCDER